MCVNVQNQNTHTTHRHILRYDGAPQIVASSHHRHDDNKHLHNNFAKVALIRGASSSATDSRAQLEQNKNFRLLFVFCCVCGFQEIIKYIWANDKFVGRIS